MANLKENDNSALILNSDDAATIEEGVAALLSVVRNRGSALPVHYSECDESQVMATLSRAFECLKATRKDAAKAILRSAKPSVDEMITTARNMTLQGYGAELDAYKAIAEILVKSPGAAAFLGKKADKPAPPDAAYVPVSSVRDFFPEDLSDEQVIAHLHQMNYKLAKGRSVDGQPRIRAEIRKEHVEAFLSERGE